MFAGSVDILSASAMKPEFVGDYRIIELVGEGSFGKVLNYIYI